MSLWTGHALLYIQQRQCMEGFNEMRAELKSLRGELKELVAKMDANHQEILQLLSQKSGSTSPDVVPADVRNRKTLSQLKSMTIVAWDDETWSQDSLPQKKKEIPSCKTPNPTPTAHPIHSHTELDVLDIDDLAGIGLKMETHPTSSL